jgi:hypothetical protein
VGGPPAPIGGPPLGADRSTGLPVYRSTGLPVYRSTGLPVYRSTGLPVYRSTRRRPRGRCARPGEPGRRRPRLVANPPVAEQPAFARRRRRQDELTVLARAMRAGIRVLYREALLEAYLLGEAPREQAPAEYAATPEGERAQQSADTVLLLRQAPGAAAGRPRACRTAPPGRLVRPRPRVGAAAPHRGRRPGVRPRPPRRRGRTRPPSAGRRTGRTRPPTGGGDSGG